MSNKCSNLMSPMHISKLGHEIEEIRNRALEGIYCKYNLQLVDEDNIENNKSLFISLLKWFNYDNYSDEDKALKLLVRVAKADNFKEIVKELNGDFILNSLSCVEKKTESCNLPLISEIKDLIMEAKRLEIKPAITELVIQSVSERVIDKKRDERIYLPWQGLSKADTKILESTYENLRYLDNMPAIILVCQFLNNVILRDFPSEVFLQRPLVVETLLELVNSNLLAEQIPVVKSILEISQHLFVRIGRLHDPGVTGKRWENKNENCELGVEDGEDLKKFQMSVSGFCNKVFQKIMPILEKPFTEDNNLAVRLVLRCVMIQGKTNTYQPIPKLFEDVFLLENCKATYYTLLTSLLLWLQNPSDLSLQLRNEIFKNIGDPGLLYFFPELHDLLLSLVSEMRDSEAEELIKDYEDCLRICGSMDAAKKLEYNWETEEYFEWFLKALPSFEFHRNNRIVQEFVRKCGAKLNDDLKNTRADILVMFLAREDMQEVAYLALKSWVEKYLEDYDQVDKLDFLCDERVWKEMWMFGASSKSKKVQRFCQDVLTELLRIEKSLASLKTSFSLMSAFAGSKTNLARNILRLFDPTTFSTLTKLDLIQANIRFMFCKEIDVNEEGFARICWILSRDDPNFQKLPKVPDIKGLYLSSMCVSVKPSPPKPHQFSTTRAVTEVMSALKNPAVSTNDLKRLLDKLAIILEDTGVHDEFLETQGLELMLNFLDKALIERDLSVYPTSVFPLMSIFKNLSLNHAAVRQSLSTKDSFILNALRSLLLFTADEVFRQNAVGLLFLLVYNDQILEVSRGISLPDVITKNIHVPISVQTHAKISTKCTTSSNRIHLMGNPLVSRMLRVHWATLCMGGLDNLAALKPADLTKDLLTPNLPEDMLLQSRDLVNLQESDFRSILLLRLEAIQNAGSHAAVLENIQHLISALTWLETWKELPGCHQYQRNMDSLPWMAILDRYFTTLPKTLEDETLLMRLISLLRSLLRTADNRELLDWIRGLLTSPTGVFAELLKSLGQSGHGVAGKELRYGVIYLAEELIQMDVESNPGPWISLMYICNEYLDTNCAEHLDCFLALLSDLTGTWTWDYTRHEKLYKSLVTHVIEVIVSFKGVAESQDSFMGSNIINNALLILGHMLCDASTNILGWEKIWEEAMRQAVGVQNLVDADYSWLLTLVSYRDPVTRASALALLSGLFASAKAYQLLIDGLDMRMGHIWATALAVITDKNECALVREKAAVLLERLTTLGSNTDCSDFLDYIKNEGIYDRISIIVDSKKASQDLTEPNTTYCLVTALSNWIFAILELNKELVAEHVAESCLIQSFIERLTEKADLTEDWLAMSASITKLIRACVKASSKARDILLTSNRIQSITSLLTIPGDEIDLKLLRLESFYLLTVLLETEQGIGVFRNSLPIDREAFFEIVSNSILSPALREHALAFVNNFATRQLQHCFTHKLPSGSFGEIVCENMLTIDLGKCAETLANVFLVSPEAQTIALRRSACEAIMEKIRELSMVLTAQSVIEFRKPQVKKKLEPVLNQIGGIYKLLTNFCFKNSLIKSRLAGMGLPDAVHRLWPWYTVSQKLQITVLQMLGTFSHCSEIASQSIALTSPPSGIRRGTLINSITQLIIQEMELLFQARGTCVLMCSLKILSNCCDALECRVALAKGAVLAPIVKLLPSERKKKTFADDVLEAWLLFLNAFTAHPEGQLCVAKDAIAMEFIFVMASSVNAQITKAALCVILHLSLHPQNRCRLLTNPAPLLNLLITVLKSGNEDNIRLSGATLWALAANSQKTKIIIRSAGCGDAIQQAFQFCEHVENRNILKKALNVICENADIRKW